MKQNWKSVYQGSKRKFFLLIILTFILISNSCSYVRVNYYRNTPKKPFKYPVFTESDTLLGKLSRFRSCFDVTFYEINIDINIQKKFLKGFVDIHFTATDDIDTLQIDLFENMLIHVIVHNHDSLSFFRKHGAVFVIFNEQLKTKTAHFIRVYYEGKPRIAPKPPWDGGFVWKTDKKKNPWIGVAVEKVGASLWWPCKDHLSDRPDSLKMHVTIPKGLFCVSNGRLIDRKTTGDKETFSWKTSYPINTYNATLYIGNYSHFNLPYHKEDTTHYLDFYVLPFNFEKAKEHFVQTIDIIRFFENTFGEYPWWNDGFKLIESPYAGMEHQTAIAYGNGYKNNSYTGVDDIILHETAHEWWGNSVCAPDYAEIWIHEGFATYCEALYIEHLFGYERYLDYLAFYAIFVQNKRPVIGPYDVNYWDYRDTDVYLKGALILHTLRNLLDNDSLFFDIIRTFYERNKYSVTNTLKFTELVAIKTQKNYGWFFNQYLYKRGCPVFEYQITHKRDPHLGRTSAIIQYRWRNVDDDFNLPVEIRGRNFRQKVYPSKISQSIVIQTPGQIKINSNESYIAVFEIENW